MFELLIWRMFVVARSWRWPDPHRPQLATDTRPVSAPWGDEWTQKNNHKSQQQENQTSIRLNDGWYQYILIILQNVCVCSLFAPLNAARSVWFKLVWMGETHLSLWIMCSSLLPFLQVHFIFINSKLERVNLIQTGCGWDSEHSPSFSLSALCCCCYLLPLLLLFLKSNYFWRVALLGL